MSETIVYIRREEIDVDKWNACIDAASNGVVYARVWWLDKMADNWDALVLGDYKAIMPLPWKKKWRIQYLYQPYFTPSLGIIAHHVDGFIAERFLNHIPSNFKYWEIDLNEGNGAVATFHKKDCSVLLRTNFMITLDKPYASTAEKYHRTLKKNLRRIENEGLVLTSISADDLVKFYKGNYADVSQQIGDGEYHKLSAALKHAQSLGQLQAFAVSSSEGEILAVYGALTDNKYIYSIVGGSTARGKEFGAFSFIIDFIIKHHSGSGKTFRFEGSDIESIAFFNRQFGAVECKYPHVKYNGLPWPVSLLKPTEK
jgi:hypothetical protein